MIIASMTLFLYYLYQVFNIYLSNLQHYLCQFLYLVLLKLTKCTMTKIDRLMVER